MSYTLVPNCTVDDAAGLARNNMSAFWQETWWNMLWVDRTLDEIIESCTLRIPQNLLTERNVRRHQKVVDTVTGHVAGYARWILPASYESRWLEAQTPDVSKEDRILFQQRFSSANWTTRDDLDELDKEMYRHMRENEPAGPYIKLDYVGVGPSHQHRGIGSMLVNSGIQAADELGLDIYLVAMGKKALAMYLKLGFTLLAQDCQDLRPYGADGVYDTYILVKHPGGQ